MQNIHELTINDGDQTLRVDIVSGIVTDTKTGDVVSELPAHAMLIAAVAEQTISGAWQPVSSDQIEERVTDHEDER